MWIISGGTMTGVASKQLVDVAFLVYSENICPSDINMKPEHLTHSINPTSHLDL